MSGNVHGRRGLRETATVRLGYVAAALATIVVGLAVHLRGGWLPPAVRDVLGDALWATMVYWWVSAGWPDAGWRARAGGALAFAFGIEFSQCYHAPGIDAVRATMLGHLVLGSDFDWRDLLAYVGGVGLGEGIRRGAVLVRAAAAGPRHPSSPSHPA